MSRARGCFIAFILVFIIGLAIVLLFIVPSLKNNSSGSESTEVAATDRQGGKTTGKEQTGGGSASGGKNYLFLGVDERGNVKNFKGRTDTIMILHIAPWGKRDLLISIPRDTKVNLPDHGTNKINAAYVYGGEEMLVNEIHGLTGISITKTMLVNFEGFKSVVDALGGVYITVDEPLHDQLSGADFEPGTYLMDGEQALAFARDRKSAKGDFDRVDRQKYLINEIFKQKFNVSIIGKAPQLLNILNNDTKSDFSTIDYINLGTILLFSNKDFETITIPGKTATIDGISYVVVNVAEVKEFLKGYLE
jgi:polyisoprenyl-teichoic acid--peptidoglycan teichoic acid transferase